MDNQCIFFSYVVKGEPKFTKLSSGSAMIQFSASSIRPNKAGLWNKNFFSAFGETAEHLEKLLQKDTVLDIVAEQQSYEKGNTIGQSYMVRDFTIKKGRKPKEGEEATDSQDLPVGETGPVKEETKGETDYQKMMAEFL